MNRSWIYWAAVLVGLCIVFMVYMRHAVPPATAPAGREGFATVQAYVEDMVGMPQGGALKMYLSSFSDLTRDGIPPYDPTVARWYSFTNSNVYMNVGATAIPNALIRETGMAMDGVQLIGPSSDLYAAPGSYELGSFSVAFFADISSALPTATNPALPVTLYEMFAETPNRVQLMIIQDPKVDTNGLVQLILGDVSHVYEWPIPKLMLTGTSGPTMYTLVYNKGDGSPANPRTARFYVNSNEVFPSDLLQDTPILLGNSRVVVNPAQNWSAKLLAMALYQAVLSADDVAALFAYWMKQDGGYAAAAAQANALAQQVSALATSNQQLQDAVATAAASCTATAAVSAAPAPPTPPVLPKAIWQIAMPVDGAVPTVPSGAMGQCSILDIPVPGQKAAAVAAPAAVAGASAAPAADVINIVNPVTGASTAVSNGGSPLTSGSINSFSTGSALAPAQDRAFWTNMEKAVNQQQQQLMVPGAPSSWWSWLMAPFSST